MDVKMPDGTVIKNVPEGVTKSQLLAKYGKMQNSMPEMRSVPDDAIIDEAPEFQAQEDPGILERLFNPPGGIGEAGPPPLTSDEGKSLLGMVAATGGAMAAPPLAVPALISKAKFLGPVASFFTKNAAKAGASGVSGAAGETSADVVQGNEINHSQMAETASEYGSAELFGSGVGELATKVLAPAKNLITEQTKKLLAFAKKENIPISAGALVPGMTEKIIKGGTDNFVPSRLVNQHYRGKMITRMNELMSEIPEGVGQVLGKEETSMLTVESFKAATQKKSDIAKSLANDYVDDIGRKRNIAASKLEEVLLDMKKNASDKDLQDWAHARILSGDPAPKGASGLHKTANDMEGLKRNIQAAFSGVKGADKQYATRIRDAINEDLDRYAPSKETIDKRIKADLFFKMNSEVFESPVAKRIAAGNLTSSQLTAQIFRSGNEKFVKKLSELLPEETLNSLKAQNLANLLENFSTQSDKVPGARILDKGDQLVKWIENNKTILKEAYDPQTVEALENFAQLAKASKGEVANYGKDMSNFGSMLNLGGIGGAAYSEPVTFAASSVGMMALAKSMMNPDGWVKQWLTTGIKGGREIGEAAKLTGRAVVSGEDE